MIDATNSSLYNIKSKKYLMYLLKIPTKDYFNQNYIATQIHPYIETGSKQPRLIEAPSTNLKKIQRRLKYELGKVGVPTNVFSGVKGRSYIQNAKMHSGNNYVFKIDFTAFFPCITRNIVYNFFLIDMQTSPDIAKILTNITTVDLERCNINNIESVEKFILNKGIKTPNHLISGAPTSQILSYLVNHKMFDELQVICDKNNILMTIYVDDITFSSSTKISYYLKNIIFDIISKNMYMLSKGKVKYYTRNYPKLVTGPIISSNGQLILRNSLSLKVMNEFNLLKSNPDDISSRNRLRGLIIASRQIEPTKFQNIYKSTFSS